MWKIYAVWRRSICGENYEKNFPPSDWPTTEQLEAELAHEKYKHQYLRTFWNTVFTLITVAAVVILLATMLLPVLKIYGTSMSPTLENGDILFTVKTADLETGDIVAFYYNNKILVKRVIAEAGDWVDIDETGTVYLNGEPLDEPYLTEKALGDCNIVLPYQVPDGKIFVMGDHRSTSEDSRNTAIGSISEEAIVGKIVFRVWPLPEIGPVH